MQKYGRSLQFKNDQEPKFILNLRDPLIQALTEFAERAGEAGRMIGEVTE